MQGPAKFIQGKVHEFRLFLSLDRKIRFKVTIYFCPNWDFLSLPVSEGGVEDPGGLRVGREFGGAGGLLAVMQWMDDYGWHGDPDQAQSDDNPD